MTATITSARVRELSAKATGGEWRISRFSSTSVDKADGRRGIATTGGYQSNREVTLPENEANAALIAALCSEPARAHIAEGLELLEIMDGNDTTVLPTAELTALRERVAQLEGALREMVYETTHLSPMRDDGSHNCIISGPTLARARQALGGTDGRS